MKNYFLIIALVIGTFVSGQNLYKGLEIGMTKKEAKSEFKKNKEQYISATLGSYEYRHYPQNNSYDKDGGLTMIMFSPKGSGLGMDKVKAKLYFLDMITLLDNTGFVEDEINIKEGNYREFAVGGGYAFHNNQSVDDVNFLTNLAIHLQDEYNLSREKTFSTGMSNGGDMSYMLACQANDVFRGIAPVAGSMMEEIYNTCDSSYPTPVFEIHGDNDNVTLWEGDMQNNDGWGAYYSIEEGIDLWVEINECQNNEQIFIPDSNPNDGSYILNHRYFNCNDNTEVWLYQVVGGGHDWPGSFGNMDINTSEEIWSFFSQYAIILGDINNDGSINVLDAISGVNLILNNEYNSSADLNVDNTVNVLDIIQLVNIILNN